LEERYAGRDDYLWQVEAAAAALVSLRYLLNEDIALCVGIAAARYDACVAQ